MLTEKELNSMAEALSEEFEYANTIKLKPVSCEDVYVNLKDGTAQIGADKRYCAARGIALLAMELLKGKKEFEIRQTAHFDMCGVMLDMSRNSVMRVSAVKKYIRIMAALGLNMLMLYTEDTYEMKKYPRFGYMRGRYSAEELKEIDDYAYLFGIEVIGCIQTLGHMEQYLRWRESSEVRDTARVLMCDEDKTYELIDEMLKTVSQNFRSRRVHIGMDEASDMCMGRFLRKNGYCDKFEVLAKHLKRVSKICEKYSLKPMLWSDTVFSLCSKTGSSRDYEAEISPEKIALMPNADFVYWDYFETDKNAYTARINNHKKLGQNVVFAGAIWLHTMLLPNFKYTMRVSKPALEACIDNGVKEVVATVWGDDGAECNQMFSLSSLPIYSEYCWRGEACSESDIKEMMSFVTGFDYDYACALSEFSDAVPYNTESACPFGKLLFYGDIMNNPVEKNEDFDLAKPKYEKALDILKNVEPLKNFEIFKEYSIKIYEIILEKCDLLPGIKNAYCNVDREYLETAANERLPRLLQNYKTLMKIHQKIWLEYSKPFGWEVLSARYAATAARVDYALEMLKEYLEGKREKIEELCEESVCDGTPRNEYNRIVYTSVCMI